MLAEYVLNSQALVLRWNGEKKVGVKYLEHGMVHPLLLPVM